MIANVQLLSPADLIELHLVIVKDRQKALDDLLEPITWPLSSSVDSRRQTVTDRHEQVHLVFPFLTPDEQKQANEWLKRESHDSLWD